MAADTLLRKACAPRWRVGAELNGRITVEGFYVWLASSLMPGVLGAVSALVGSVEGRHVIAFRRTLL